jgi:hypothetical protein
MFLPIHVINFFGSSVRIGRLDQPSQNIAENILAGVKAIADRVPRGFRNFQSLHLKTIDSIALPIYNSLPPQPTRLPGVEAAPVVKKIKLDEDGGESGLEIEEAEVVDKDDENDESAIISESANEETVVEDSGISPSTVKTPKRLKVSDYIDATLKRSAVTPITNEIRGGVKRKVSARKSIEGVGRRGGAASVRKLSTKKVRGSTIVSSQFEKTERKRRRRTMN